MKLNRAMVIRFFLLISLMANLTILSSKIQAGTGSCGGVTVTLPFNDAMASPFFCQIAAAYFSGLTNGTTATTYSPSQNVTREQMAAFTTRTLDQSLRRNNKRVVTEKWWTPQDELRMPRTLVGSRPSVVKFDGADVWVTNNISGSVMRIRASDGKVLDTWTGVTAANGLVAAMGYIYVCGSTVPGTLYRIDPTQPAESITPISNALGNASSAIAFDGARLWVANSTGSVSIVRDNPTAILVTNVTAGFIAPRGILYDGSNIWVSDAFDTKLKKLNPDGSVAQTVNVGALPAFPVFDGTNIWVPNLNSNSVTVVRVKDAQGNPLATPFVLATLTGNGLNEPFTVAFDGERILVTNFNGDSVSLWKAADLTPLGSFPTGAGSSPFGACSDGAYFWIALADYGQVVRF